MRTVSWTVGSTTVVSNISDTATATQVRVAIQTAVDSAESAAASAGQPATVTLSAGDFVINGTGTASQGGINIGSNVTFQGTTSGGVNQTTIKLSDSYTSSDVTGIVRTTSEAGVHDVVIKNLNIEGNGQISSTDQEIDGIYTGFNPNGAHDPAEAHSNITIENVDVSNVSRYGVDPHEQTINLTIRDSVSHDNGVDGFVLDYIEGGLLENNEAYGNGRHGFNLVTGTYDIVMNETIAHDNGAIVEGSGIVIQPPSASTDGRILYSHDITITGGAVYSNHSAGIRIANGQGITIEDVDIYDNFDNGVFVTNQSRDPGDPVIPFTNDVWIVGNTITSNGLLSDGAAEIRIFTDVGSVTVLSNRIGATGSIDFITDFVTGPITIDGNRYEKGFISYEMLTPVAFLDDPAVVGAMSLHSWNASANTINYDTGRQYVKGNGGDDTISTGVDNDSLLGNAGNDSLNGGSGTDGIWGGTGNDSIDGGSGADRMHGGQGDDVFVVNDAGDVVNEGFESGDDLVQSSVTYSLVNSVNVEDLILTGTSAINGTGNNLANALTGNSGNNNLSGGNGADSLIGNNGADTMSGGSYNDTLTGGGGNDQLNGNFGNDLIVGGAGTDQMTGGGGNDTFDFNASTETGIGSVRDVIADFSKVSGNTDTIDISGLDANLDISGNQAFQWIGTAAFTAAGQLRYQVIGGNSVIMANTGANLGTDYEIEVSGTPSLVGADFIL